MLCWMNVAGREHSRCVSAHQSVHCSSCYCLQRPLTLPSVANSGMASTSSCPCQVWPGKGIMHTHVHIQKLQGQGAQQARPERRLPTSSPFQQSPQQRNLTWPHLTPLFPQPKPEAVVNPVVSLMFTLTAVLFFPVNAKS